MAETSYLFPCLGDHRTGSRDFEETVGIGWTLVRDIELRFSGVHRGANVKELSALVGWYF